MRESHSSTVSPSASAASPRRRRTPRWVVVFVLLLVLFAMGPTLVARSSLRNQLVGWLLPQFDGKVVIGSATAGWFRPCRLYDVAITDGTDRPLAQAPYVTSEKTLLQWLWQPQRLGTFELQQPQLHVRLTRDGSNIETLLQSLAGEETSESGGIPSFSVRLREGQLQLHDDVSDERCLIDGLDLAIDVPAGPPAPLHVRFRGRAQQGHQQGSTEGMFEWQMPEQLSLEDVGDGQLHVLSDGFPLLALQPLVQRVAPNLKVEGQLISNLKVTWNRSEQGPKVVGHGDVQVRHVRVRDPGRLGDESLQLDKISCILDVQNEGGRVRVNSIRIDSDVAHVTVEGAFTPHELQGPSPWDVLADWRSSYHGSIEGDIDVARLAALLPETLRVKQNTRITQGMVRLAGSSKVELGQRVWQASLQTDQLEAVAAGRPIRWDQPVELAFLGTSGPQGVMLRRCEWQSDFLQANAAGTLAEGRLQIDGELHTLWTQLEQFVDLGDVRIAGTWHTDGSWQREDTGGWSIHTDSTVRDFAFTASSGQVQEPELQVGLSGRATFADGGPVSLEQAQLSFRSGGDRFAAHTTQSVAPASGATLWPVHFEMEGHTRSWLDRLRPWVQLDGWEVQAQIAAEGNGQFGGTQFDLPLAQIELSQASIQGPGILIREPMIAWNGAVRWDATAERLTLPSFTVTSPSFAARGHQVTLALDTLSADGQVAFRGDLQRLADWRQSPLPASTRLRGMTEGSLQFQTDGQQVSILGQAEATSVALDQRDVRGPQPTPWQPFWNDPRVEIDAECHYDIGQDRLAIDRLRMQASLGNLEGQGNLQQITQTPSADVRGTLSYDLEQLSGQLASFLGPEISLKGARTSTFEIQGPLSVATVEVASASPVSPSQSPLVSPKLVAQTSLGWDELAAYGLILGPQELTARLEQGTLRMGTLRTPLSGGTVSLTPEVQLNNQPMLLHLAPGPFAERVQLTPEMLHGWMKYVAPLLAEAATAEGRLSAELQGAQIPLSHPTSAAAGGSLRLEGARVRPGPLANQVLSRVTEFATLLDRSAPDLGFLTQGQDWLEIPPQQVDFQVAQGRVFHRNLEVRAGDFVIRTKGWVGMDQTLGVLAEIPIQEAWVADKRWLAGLAGQSLKIPIQGTFSRPRLDRQAMTELSRGIMQDSAQRVLQDELQKGLQKLLGPK